MEINGSKIVRTYTHHREKDQDPIRQKLIRYWYEHPQSQLALSRAIGICHITLSKFMIRNIDLNPMPFMRISMFLEKWEGK